ncbi:MAG: hypothetical protein IIA06_11130 [Proteobacteria bacterium]|nr:hypothetical protein [Pseudomonadota bacterium]
MISSLKSKFSSSTRRALLVSSDKLAVYHWVNNNLGSSYLFDGSPEGFEYFGHYLDEVPNDPVYVLLDTAGEEYRLDTIPHVFGADRRATIERKQDRMFRGTPYRYAEVQGREKKGRRDDNVMFSAVTNPDTIQLWLKILEEHKVPVAGVVSVPLLLQNNADVIPDMSGNALVFSLQSMSGLRQSFFKDKLLKFSRLVKVPRYGTEPYAPIITEELVKVRRYLQGTQLLDQDRPLDIHFLGNKELLDELGKTHVNSAMVRYHMLDVEALGKSYGSTDQIRTPFSDKHLVYQLLKNKSKNYYAPNKDIRYFQMRQINKALKVASLLFMLTGFIWGGLNVLEGYTYRQQHISDSKKADFYNVRYEVAQERISALPVDPADLKVVVDTIGTLKTYKSEPDDMFRLISKSMDIFPEIQISKIQWAANINPNHKLGAGKLDSIINEGIQGVLGFSNISDEETGYLYYQIALVNCYLDKFDGDYRKALNTIDQFAGSLRRQDSVHDVSVVSLPLDISSEATLQGSTKEDSSKSNFSVRVVLGIKDEA